MTLRVRKLNVVEDFDSVWKRQARLAFVSDVDPFAVRGSLKRGRVGTTRYDPITPQCEPCPLVR
jgi:hypothetical protein